MSSWINVKTVHTTSLKSTIGYIFRTHWPKQFKTNCPFSLPIKYLLKIYRTKNGLLVKLNSCVSLKKHRFWCMMSRTTLISFVLRRLHSFCDFEIGIQSALLNFKRVYVYDKLSNPQRILQAGTLKVHPYIVTWKVDFLPTSIVLKFLSFAPVGVYLVVPQGSVLEPTLSFICNNDIIDCIKYRWIKLCCIYQLGVI